MRTTFTVIALATGPVLFAAALAQPPSQRPAQSQGAPKPQMSAQDIIRSLEAQGYRDFQKIERKHGLYEVRAFNPQGRSVKLYVDGATGQVLAQHERQPGSNDDDD